MAAETERDGARWTHVSTRMLYILLALLLASAVAAGIWIARRSSGADPFRADRVPAPAAAQAAAVPARPLTAAERQRCLETLDMRYSASNEARQTCKQLLAPTNPVPAAPPNAR